jgi:hypothetical protein
MVVPIRPIIVENSGMEESANSTGEGRANPLIQKEQDRAKAEVSRTATVRIQAYERALKLLPFVERARRELEDEYHRKFYLKDVSHRAIANRLNEFCKEEGGTQCKPPHGQSWSGKQVTENIMRAPERIIECAVLECRTRMTAFALSADFTRPFDAVTELEREYLGYVADAIEIEHRLNGNRTRTREELLDEARHRAIEVAANQRRMKPLSMMARERLWKHFPPVVRKVFEQ